MKFSGKMCLMIILKVTKKTGFHPLFRLLQILYIKNLSRWKNNCFFQVRWFQEPRYHMIQRPVIKIMLELFHSNLSKVYIYAIMTICPTGYPHNRFVATINVLGHMMHDYPLQVPMNQRVLNKLRRECTISGHK